MCKENIRKILYRVTVPLDFSITWKDLEKIAVETFPMLWKVHFVYFSRCFPVILSNTKFFWQICMHSKTGFLFRNAKVMSTFLNCEITSYHLTTTNQVTICRLYKMWHCINYIHSFIHFGIFHDCQKPSTKPEFR